MYRSHGLLSAPLVVAVALAAASGALADCECKIEVQADQTRDITTNTTTDCVCVYGTLNIAAGVTLTLNGANEATTSTIDGTVNLEGSGSTLAFSSNNHTISGSGDIDGHHNSARIDISSAVTVTIGANLTVHGSMQIRADGGASSGGTLDNDGLVEADDNGGTLDCYDGTFAGSGEYKVAWSGATLKFTSGIDDAGLAADFTVGAGTLYIDEDICTTGDLSFIGGMIDVQAGDSFKAGGTCP